MWYFAWILGVLLACTLGVINVMWYEMEQHKDSVADDEARHLEDLFDRNGDKT